MSLKKRISIAWGAFWSGIKPEFHNHYENNFDIARLINGNEEIIRENQDLRIENKSLNKLLSESVMRNSNLESTIDSYGTIFEIMLTYINDKDSRKRISAILEKIKEDKVKIENEKSNEGLKNSIN